jgi:hypothetical protein
LPPERTDFEHFKLTQFFKFTSNNISNGVPQGAILSLTLQELSDKGFEVPIEEFF